MDFTFSQNGSQERPDEYVPQSDAVPSEGVLQESLPETPQWQDGDFVAEAVPDRFSGGEQSFSGENRFVFPLFIGGFIVLAVFFLSLTLFTDGGIRSNFIRSRQLTNNLRELDPDQSDTSIDRTLLEASEPILQEIESIRTEQGLPEQVFRREVDPEHNVASSIRKEFQAFNPKTYQAIRNASLGFSETWHVDSEVLKRYRPQIDAVVPQRDRIRKMLDREDATFEQEFVMSEDFLVPDDDGVDTVRVYLLLEELEIAEALGKRDMAGAIKSILYMFRLVDMLSQSKFLVPRFEAVHHRENVLFILQTLVMQDDFRHDEAMTVFKTIYNQLRNWPPDSRCWISDRAASLRVYDLLRRGKISEALEPEELQELQELNVLGVGMEPDQKGKKGGTLLGKVAYYREKDIDRDEEQYLKLMRRFLESCSKPFCARLETIDRIEDDVYSLRGTKDYLAIATILLRGIRQGMQRQAEDRARMDAWYLAFASALDLPMKDGALDPVYGLPYRITEVTVENQPRIVVRYSNEKKVEVRGDLR